MQQLSLSESEVKYEPPKCEINSPHSAESHHPNDVNDAISCTMIMWVACLTWLFATLSAICSCVSYYHVHIDTRGQL